MMNAATTTPVTITSFAQLYSMNTAVFHADTEFRIPGHHIQQVSENSYDIIETETNVCKCSFLVKR